MPIKKASQILLNNIVVFYFLYSSCFACDSLEELRSTFKIENNILTTAIGKQYFPHPFECKLHFDLAYHMKDLDAADKVYKAYKNHILPTFKKIANNNASASEEAFSKALIEVCLLFGNPNHSPEKSFLCGLIHQGKYGSEWIEKFPKELKSFIYEANTALYTVKNKKNDIFTVVIITTTASGGNHSVAESIATYLTTQEHIETVLINVEDIAIEVDPILIATGTYTYDMIYSHIFQKTNDFSVIPGRKKLSREIQKYIPNSLLAKLKQKIIDLKPDFIISTRSYTADDIALASLGIPFRLIHTDFELCPSLCAYYRNVSPDSIRFWLPVFSPSMFRPIFEHYGCLDIYDEKDDYTTVLEKTSLFLGVSSMDYKAQFELIGYPCSNFFQINNDIRLNELRQKWDVQRNEIPIFIVMGKHGTFAIKKIFDNLLHVKTTLPLKYLFICGNNKKMQSELKEKLLNLKFDEKKIVIHGLLSPAEMNEIMNISSMGISKAGGATVIESLATNRPLLLMHSFPWEEINASFLTKMNLAVQFESKKSLIEQIEDCIKRSRSNSQKIIPLENWQNNLMLNLHPYIQKKSETLKHRNL